MASLFKINDRLIGQGQPVYIIAELSCSHRQDFNHAVALMKAAKEAGADAVKVQTFTPDGLTIASDKPYFRIGGGTQWDGTTLYDLYKIAAMPWEWQPKLKALAKEMKIDFFSTPVDATSVDFLENMGMLVYKVASFEMNDIPLIKKIAKTGKPMILSTGLATLAEIEESVNAIRQIGNNPIALLKCTSAYPAPEAEMNLNTIPHLIETFKVPIGLSDHTLGIIASVVAATLGATIIEKHFMLSRTNGGPDSAFSLEPAEFKQMVNAIRSAEKVRGKIQYGPVKEEMKNVVFRRSIFVVKNIEKGEAFTPENIRVIRPGYGLQPKYFENILGHQASQVLEAGTPLEWKYISNYSSQQE